MSAQHAAARLAQLLSRIERERQCPPSELAGILLGAAAMVAIRHRQDGVDATRGRELFTENAARLYDAVEAQERDGAPLVRLVTG